MTEANALKAGDKVDKIVNGQTLKLKPIPYGRLKELMRIIFAAMDQFTKLNNKDIFLQFPKVLEENLPKIMPLMFDRIEHPWLNEKWIDDNLSLVDMKEIVEKMIVINGLTDFLGKMGGAKASPAPKTKVELAPVS